MRVLNVNIYFPLFVLCSIAVDGFHVKNELVRKPYYLPSQVVLHTSSIPSELDSAAVPNPELGAVEVASMCMEALKTRKSAESLELCFSFSSDRCRAAVGGTLEEFVRYAANPVFGTLIGCDNYEILKIGPVIPGGPHRGEMQTVLIEIEKGATVRDALEAGKKNARKRPTLEERFRQREMQAKGIEPQPQPQQPQFVDDGKRKFLWTLQKERRPPRQDCWLVHEVLFTKNAWQQTM
jgi:hypothetical protein